MLSYRFLVLSDVGEGPSLEASWEILMASSIAANNPSPPSPRRAGPKHSGLRIRSLTTTLAFSSTLSPGNSKNTDSLWVDDDTFSQHELQGDKGTSLLVETNWFGRWLHESGLVQWNYSSSHHCKIQQSAGSPGSVLPPRGSSRCQGILYTAASHSSAAHSRPGTAPPGGSQEDWFHTACCLYIQQWQTTMHWTLHLCLLWVHELRSHFYKE